MYRLCISAIFDRKAIASNFSCFFTSKLGGAQRAIALPRSWEQRFGGLHLRDLQLSFSYGGWGRNVHTSGPLSLPFFSHINQNIRPYRFNMLNSPVIAHFTMFMTIQVPTGTGHAMIDHPCSLIGPFIYHVFLTNRQEQFPANRTRVHANTCYPMTVRGELKFPWNSSKGQVINYWEGRRNFKPY